MKRQSMKLHMDGLAALLLFGIFAVCVLLVLLTGAGAYERLTARDQASYDRRVCTQYLATRVRQADNLGNVSVEPFDGETALCLIDRDGYLTRVYYHDGYLMELYTSVDAEMAPEDGERLMKASGLLMALEDGLLELTVTGPDGVSDRLFLSLRCREGAAA